MECLWTGALAVYLALKHFNYFLQARDFTIFTDYLALTKEIDAPSTSHSTREIRHLDYIAQYTTDIRHVKGKDNDVADALSRICINSVEENPNELDIDYATIARVQDDDSSIKDLVTAPGTLNYV